MGNPGKNKIMRYARLFFGGFDLSGDSRVFSSCDWQCGEVDMTGWNQSIRNYLPDQFFEAGIRGYNAFMNDTPLSGAFTLLKTADGGVTPANVSLFFGGNAEPTYGDPSYSLSAAQMSGQTTQDGGAFVIAADFLPLAGVTASGIPWGVVHHPVLSRSATFAGTSVDNLAATTLGYAVLLHIIATASGNFAFKIEHSTNDSTWADLVTFTINGGTLTSEYKTGSGTVNRYTRLSGTRTGGTCTPVCSLIRL